VQYILRSGYFADNAWAVLQLRNTARFALGNLHDFDPSTDAVPTSELPLLERFILHRLDATSHELTAAYDELNFAKVQTVLMQVRTQ
jgi:isoleucyl-tRNA synthetase